MKNRLAGLTLFPYIRKSLLNNIFHILLLIGVTESKKAKGPVKLFELLLKFLYADCFHGDKCSGFFRKIGVVRKKEAKMLVGIKNNCTFAIAITKEMVR